MLCEDLIENLPLSGVKCILGQYILKPSVNLPCDYKIVFYDGQQRYLK